MSSLAEDNARFAKDRFITMTDGTPIAYTVVGDGAKVPILFVNGWSATDTYWCGIGPAVVEGGHRAVFVDTRGHGQSGLPRPPGFNARGLRPEERAKLGIADGTVRISVGLEDVEDVIADQGAALARQLDVPVARARGARKLSLRVLGTNATAMRLYERLGFQVEGTLRDEFCIDGRYVDDVLMAKHLA